jgi:hypothetical protein
VLDKLILPNGVSDSQYALTSSLQAMADYGIQECRYNTVASNRSISMGESSRIIITFNSVDTLTLINPFTISVKKFQLSSS